MDALGFAVRPEAGTSLAVEIRSMEKFRRYCPVLDEDAAQDFDRCVPFIVDATGNCSDVALRLLLEAVGGGPKKREQLAIFCPRSVGPLHDSMQWRPKDG